MYMENQKKPLIYYWLIALAVMFVINWLVLPMFANNTVQEVSYNVFLDELEAKNKMCIRDRVGGVSTVTCSADQY